MEHNNTPATFLELQNDSDRSCNKNGKTTTSAIDNSSETKGRTRHSRRTSMSATLPNQQVNQEKGNGNKIVNNSAALANVQTKIEFTQSVPESTNSNGSKRRSSTPELSDKISSKRVRQQFQPFQAIGSVPSSSSKSTPQQAKEKLVIYSAGDFLAVRNEANSFFLCRVKQNISKNGRKARIQWYSNEANPDVYVGDFFDLIDFESILTNVRVVRMGKNQVSLQENEKQRVTNILERAINVEKGINAPPDPSKVICDGLDISVIGKAEEKKLLQQLKASAKKTLRRNGKVHRKQHQTHSNAAQQNGDVVVVTKDNDDDDNSSDSTEIDEQLLESANSDGGSKAKLTTTPEASSVVSVSSTNVTTPIATKTAVNTLSNNNNTANTNTTTTTTEVVVKKEPKKRGRKPKRTVLSRATKSKMAAAANGKNTVVAESSPSKQIVNKYKNDDQFKVELGMNNSMTQANSELEDLMFGSSQALPSVSSQIDSKLLIRAVLLENSDMLKHHLNKRGTDNDTGSMTMLIQRAVNIPLNAVHYALLKKDLLALNLLLNSTRVVNRSKPLEQCNNSLSMELHHSDLMLDCQQSNDQCFTDFQLDQAYAKFALKNDVPLSFVRKVLPYFVNKVEDFTIHLVHAIRRGNCDIAHYLAQEICTSQVTESPFNEVHLSLLGRDVSQPIDYQSLDKFAFSPKRILPIHLAAVNPDPYYFSWIFDNSKETLYSLDSDGWSAIHYTSVSKTYFNLHYLLNIGVSTLNPNNKGNTPLHLATLCNRLENAALIIDNELTTGHSVCISLRTYNKAGYTPLHLSCKKGFTNLVKLFIENKVEVDRTSSASSGELAPLMIAAQQGHLQVVKLLVESGNANVNCYDKKHRTALFHAIINGHSHIVRYLLQKGANASNKDQLGNNLLHYALAYGWYHCYEILLSTNVNIKDTNVFGLTAMYAPLLKGYLGLVMDILQRKIYNIDAPVNDLGANLGMLTFLLHPSCEMINLLKLLIEQYGCDVNKVDYNGNNMLHYYLKCEVKCQQINSDSVNQTLDQALSILLHNNCDPFAENQAAMSPVLFALNNNCPLAFKRFLFAHNKSVRFQQIVSDNEHLFPMLITHLLEPIEPNQSVARYLITLHQQFQSWQTIFKELYLKPNKSGDIPVEFLIKYSKQILLKSKVAKNEQDFIDFFDHLLKQYKWEFLRAIELLHLAAKHGSACIMRQLLLTKQFQIEALDEDNLTPLAISVEHANIEAAKILIETGAKVDCTVRQHSCLFAYLQNNQNLDVSFEFALQLVKQHQFDTNETDADLNTVLHLVCAHACQEYCIELVAALLAKGVDINAQNRLGQTALHVALNANPISEQLCQILRMLIEKRINLYLKDNSGLIAFNYLFISNTDEHQKQLDVLELIDPKQYNLGSLVDKNGVNLLHYAAKVGNTACVSYLKTHIEPGKVDNLGATPLLQATFHKQRDCAFILLDSKMDLLANYEYTGVENETINLFDLMSRNGWTDLLLKIIEKCRHNGVLFELTQLLIKSQCIEYSIMALNMAKSSMTPFTSSQLTTLLASFGKAVTNQVDAEIQVKFLNLFSDNMIKQSCGALFVSAIANWNHVLCEEIMKFVPVEHVMTVVKQNITIRNPISLLFAGLFKQTQFPEPMKELTILLLEHSITLNSLSQYPMIESKQLPPRYCYDMGKQNNANNTPTTQCTPLIVAIINGCTDVVKWMLSLKHKNSYVVDLKLVDSNGRTPLMHAVFNNNIQVVKLLLDRTYCPEKDHCSSEERSTRVSIVNRNELDLLARDKNKRTVFHYLIQPFDYLCYFQGVLIFSLLWQLLEEKHKTKELISELYQLACENFCVRIASFLANYIQESSSLTKPCTISFPFTHDKKQMYDFKTDYENLLGQWSQNPKICPPPSVRNMLQDEQLGVPFDATFTKLDSQKDMYVYNFYKIQIFELADKFVLRIRWGRVGSTGCLKKIFFDSKEKAIEEFKRIFLLKSGNEWASECMPNEDKYRMVTKRNTANQELDFELKVEQLLNIKSELSIEIRDLLLRWVKSQLKAVERYRGEYKNHLNSDQLLRCYEMLRKIYALAFGQKMSINRKGKQSLKFLNDIIDLSEEFYNTILIYGKKFDQLQPILTTEDVYEKCIQLHQLAAVVFANELLYCASKKLEVNPLDYLYDSFRYEVERVHSDSEECHFVQFYLSNSATSLSYQIESCYRVKVANDNSTNSESTRNSYLLWYRLSNNSLLQTFVQGLQPAPISDSNSQLIFEAIHLSNKINQHFEAKDELCYLMLCELQFGNVLEIGANEAIDLSVLEPDSVISRRDIIPTGENMQNYLCWKGLTLPFCHNRQSSSVEFYAFNSNQVIPRYLVEYKPLSIPNTTRLNSS